MEKKIIKVKKSTTYYTLGFLESREKEKWEKELKG